MVADPDSSTTEKSQDCNADASKSASGDDNDDDNDDVLDYIETPLNACSLETFCHHIPGPGEHQNNSIALSQSVIPLCLGCYQLNESTGKREGRLDLYAIPVLHNNHDQTQNCSHSSSSSSIDNFGVANHPPLTIFGGDGDEAPGVLDGKWSTLLPSSSSSRSSRGDDNYSVDDFQNYYATAHANGEIWVHEISSNTTGVDAHDIKNENPQNPFRAAFAGKTTSPSTNEGLCLALAWENPLNDSDDDHSNRSFDTRIISSYSDGHAAIHRVTEQSSSSSSSVENNTPKLELALEHHWDAHQMFTSPAEVWCANFIGSNNIVVTGGDEGTWKVWDLRQPLTKPVHHGKDDFEAGVTVLSPHPRHENLLAVGSYDETIALFDLRRMATTSNSNNKRPETLYRSGSLGGGIWRLKWHPFEDNRLLVAAMHGGCVVGEFDGLDKANFEEQDDAVHTMNLNVQKEFKNHQSMAYGIDWLAYPGTANKSSDAKSGGVEVAASCSFYDKAMYLWKTGSTRND